MELVITGDKELDLMIVSFLTAIKAKRVTFAELVLHVQKPIDKNGINLTRYDVNSDDV